MVKVTTRLSKEFQETYPRVTSRSVGAIRHTTEPVKHTVTKDIVKLFENATHQGITVLEVKESKKPQVKKNVE